jgi:outer membrane protein assembly factor BamE (lipoprotein component of BamABCDE complex)
MISIALCGVLAACAPRVQVHGDEIESDRLSRVIPYTHRKEDVASILGSPSTTPAFDDNAWYYVSSRMETVAFLPGSETQRQVVVIRFDPQGVVTAVEAFGLERGRKVELVDRETPTYGTDMSALEQFMSNVGRFERDEAPRR